MRKLFSLHVILAVCICVLVLARLYLVTTRYFDPDEFAHLHWSFLLYKGYVPYKDFFINFSPVYFWLFSLLYFLPHGSYLIVLARIIQFLLYLGIACSVYLITIRLKNKTAGILAVIIFLTFPVTFDKTLEIRHDTLMTLLFFAAVTLLVYTKKLSLKNSFFVGVLSSLSSLVLTKIVVFLPSIWIYYLFVFRKGKTIATFIVGFLLPVILFALYLIVSGTPYLSWENIVHGSQILKAGEGTFSVLKTLSPYQYVYVATATVSLPWIVSTSLWIIAIVSMLFLLRTHRVFALSSICFFVGSFLSVILFPTPYTQYFIPPSTLASILAGIGIISFGSQVNRFLKYTSLFLLSITVGILVCSFWLQMLDRFGEGVSMNEQKTVIRDVLLISQPDETFYDMVGSYVFRPNGYYICCNIYSSFAPFLNIPLPSLSQSLINNKTKYIVLDRAGKSLWLPYPHDLAFLVQNYLPSAYPKIYTAGSHFSCIFGSCTQMDMSDKPIAETSTISLLYSDEYQMQIKPATQWVTIGKHRYTNGQKATFEKGKYELTVPPDVTYVRIQLAR